MDREKLWQRIRYRKGRLFVPEREASISSPIVIVRRERNNLLVRCDSRPPIALGSRVHLEIWGPDALTTIDGQLEGMVPRSYGGCILTVAVAAANTHERRASRRYNTRFLATFVPQEALRGHPAEGGYERYATGHATNIALGGMQLDTEYDMPVGTMLHLRIAAPGGPLQATGRIVNKRQDAVGRFEYGIELTDFDSLTAARLHRIVKRMERDQIRRRRPSRYADPTAPGRRFRYGRFRYGRRVH